jgi:hypothetical protein
LCLLWCVSCAGDLRDPERFAFVIDHNPGGADSGKSNLDAATPSLDAGGGGASTPAPACLTALFAAKCATSACHGAGAPQVDLVSSGVEMRVVGKPSSATGQCVGKTLVSTNGSASLLADKVSATPPCGSKMPLGGSLSDTDLACLDGWVSTVSGKQQ